VIEMNEKTTCLKLESLEDVKILIVDILQEIKDNNMMYESSGKIVQLLQCWLKAYQIDELEQIKKRISKLEAKNEN
jgi:hypothetical protein